MGWNEKSIRNIMIAKDAIIVEDRLEELFDYLPEQVVNSVSYKPVFKVGDEEDLLAFFKQSKGKTNYPLVWLQMPYLEEHKNRTKVELTGLSFILAVETNAAMLNDERMTKTFKPLLYPLLNNILDVFRVGNIITYDGDFTITKFSNFSDEEEIEKGEFVDIWDVIKLTIDLVIDDSCLREIKL